MVKIKKCYTEEDMVRLDAEGEFVSFGNKNLFYELFSKKLDVLKLFLLSQLGLDIHAEDCIIVLKDIDAIGVHREDKLEIRVIINNLGVRLFVKRDSLKNEFKFCKKMLVLINLNIKNWLTAGGKKIRNGLEKLLLPEDKDTSASNRYALVIYPEYYRDLYFHKRIDVDKKDMWFVLFSCRSFQEIYLISCEIFAKEMRDDFIRGVIEECRKINNEKEKRRIKKKEDFVNRCFERGKEEYNRGIKIGAESTINKCIKNMLKEDLGVELISKITEKDAEYVNLIKKL